MPLESNPFTRLGVGGTFSRTFTIFRERWVDFLTISAVIFVPFLFFMVTILGMTLSVNKAVAQEMEQEDGTVDPADFLSIYKSTFHHVIGQLVVEQIFYILIGIAARAMMAMMVAELYADRRPSLMECFQKTLRLFCNIFCAGFIVGGVMMLGYVLLVLIIVLCIYAQSGLVWLLGVGVFLAAMVAMVYVSVSMMLLSAVVMVEQKGPMEAIRRCWDLASGHRCFLYCTVFLLSLANYIFQQIVAAIFLGSDPDQRASVFGCLVQFASLVFVLPLAAIITTVVYLNIRAEQEGLNRDVLLQDLTGDGTSNSKSATTNSMAHKYEALDMEGGFVSSVPLV